MQRQRRSRSTLVEDKIAGTSCEFNGHHFCEQQGFNHGSILGLSTRILRHVARAEHFTDRWSGPLPR
jgi:hypothetical protein